MKKIKICGITEQKEVEYLNKAGVDYAGFIQFFPKSKRNLSVAKAKELIARLDSKIQSVAVVVSPSGEQLREIEGAGFSMVQIHGEISDSLLAAVKLPVLKAFNITDLSEFSRFEENENVVGYVFDAQVPGSGKTFDWSVLKKIPATSKMTLLAGGLNPSNVAEALLSTNVDGVDTSSGVERESGAGKDPEKIRAFVQAVKGVEV
jgi:phosphoribosylanthranilate isomerase